MPELNDRRQMACRDFITDAVLKYWKRNLVFTILAAIATYERRLIHARTSEGRKRALQDGTKFGRRPKLTAHQRAEAVERRAAGETLIEIARSYAVNVSTISRLPYSGNAEAVAVA
jgi:DNA invertase Pin-like site-specific DNA recombinase